MPTQDMEDSRADKGIINLIATTIQHQYSLTEIDSMFIEAEENLEAVCQDPRVGLMVRDRALELLGKMTAAQREYDSYFGKGRIEEAQFPAIKRPLAYQPAAYHYFIQQAQPTLEQAGVFIEKNYDKTEDLPLFEVTGNPSFSNPPAKTVEEKLSGPERWVYS